LAEFSHQTRVLGGLFGVVQAPRVDQINDDVRCLVKAIVVGDDLNGWRTRMLRRAIRIRTFTQPAAPD
jgi:hypothetical protein